MSYSYRSPVTNHHSRPARRKAWLAMCVASLAVAAVAFVIFGLVGGFVLLIGLNGFTEKQATPIFITYFVLVFGITTLVAALFNWLIIRRGFPAAGLSGWAAFVPAAASSVGLLLVGPVLAVVLIQAFFRSGL
ncbi:MAG: hypothetical protein M3416_19635 [Acidobacteriota bacterium]|nr:hypothetical protein [Acidobacteriota bacterium]